MEYVPKLVTMGFLLGLSAFFSGSETAFYSLTPLDVHQFRSGSGRLGNLAAQLRDRSEGLLVTILLGNMAVNVLYFSMAAVVAVSLKERGWSAGAAAVSVGALVALILMGEVVPKALAVNVPVTWARAASGPLAVVMAVVSPVRWFFQMIMAVFNRIVTGRIPRQPLVTAEEMKALVQLSHQEGQLDKDEGRLLLECLEMADVRVKEIMVPRVDVVAFPLEGTKEDLFRLASETKMSKVPVYEGTSDHIRGTVKVKNLYLYPDKDLSSLLEPVVFVPEDMPAVDLQLFRDQHRAWAIVVDEYGGTEGLVTLEDVLEEIVGEIRDEYDATSDPVREVEDGVWRVQGTLAVRAWAHVLGDAVEEGKVRTFSGLLTWRLGRLPKKGDVVIFRNLEMTVLETRGMRVEWLKLRFLTPGESSEGGWAVIGVYLVALAFLVGASAYFSGFETGVYALNKVRLRIRAEQGHRSARRVNSFLKDMPTLLATLLVGNNIAVDGATFVMILLLESRGTGNPEFVSTLIMTPLMFVMGEVLPKNLFSLRPNALVYPTSGVVTACRWLFLPLVWIMGTVARLVSRMGGSKAELLFSRQRLGFLLSQGVAEGVVPAQAQEIADNILRLSRTYCRQVMIPLEEAACIAEGASAEEVKDLARRTGRTRFPVLGYEGKAIGVVSIFDLALHADREASWEDLLQKPVEFHEDFPVDDALFILQRRKRQIAVIVDGNGCARGVATIKDLVEEVVGEIAAW